MLLHKSDCTGKVITLNIITDSLQIFLPPKQMLLVADTITDPGMSTCSSFPSEVSRPYFSASPQGKRKIWCGDKTTYIWIGTCKVQCKLRTECIRYSSNLFAYILKILINAFVILSSPIQLRDRLWNLKCGSIKSGISMMSKFESEFEVELCTWSSEVARGLMVST